MFFKESASSAGSDLSRLSLEDLIAIQPKHIRGKLQAGRRGPEGERPGRGRANSLDFDGLSLYVPGDDVRTIDWRATNRSGQVVVRRFAAASHRAHMIVVDLRPDLLFGTTDTPMAKTACLAAAWLAWKALLLHEPVGLAIGGDMVAPKRGRRHVLHLLDRLAGAYRRLGHDAATDSVDCEAAASLIGRQDELCVVADLPTDPEPYARAGRALSQTRVLCYVLVEDPIQTRAPEPGRYPSRGPDGRRRVVRSGGADPSGPGIEGIVRDAGWIIERARDVLPRWTLR